MAPLWCSHQIVELWLCPQQGTDGLSAGRLLRTRRCDPTLPGTSPRRAEHGGHRLPLHLFLGTVNLGFSPAEPRWSLRGPRSTLERATTQPGAPSFPELASWGRPQAPKGLTSSQCNVEGTLFKFQAAI